MTKVPHASNHINLDPRFPKFKINKTMILEDTINSPISCQALLDCGENAVISSNNVNGFHTLPPSASKIYNHLLAYQTKLTKIDGTAMSNIIQTSINSGSPSSIDLANHSAVVSYVTGITNNIETDVTELKSIASIANNGNVHINAALNKKIEFYNNGSNLIAEFLQNRVQFHKSLHCNTQSQTDTLIAPGNVVLGNCVGAGGFATFCGGPNNHTVFNYALLQSTATPVPGNQFAAEVVLNAPQTADLSLKKNNQTKLQINSSGNIITHSSLLTSGGASYTTSDERIKRNIVDASLNKAYNIIKQIELKEYDYNDPSRNHTDFGFIAQQVKSVNPDYVTIQYENYNSYGTKDPVSYDENGNVVEPTGVITDLHFVDKPKLFQALFGAVKFLQEKVERLEEEINLLKN